MEVGARPTFALFQSLVAWPSQVLPIAPAPLLWRSVSFAIGAKALVQEATVRRKQQHEWRSRTADRVERCLDSERCNLPYQTAAAEARLSRVQVLNMASHVSAMSSTRPDERHEDPSSS
ncbi:hypothetical protein PMIN03_009640 [Paraphaeosphaeria minitans]|uniref:Uncharacterized protein n=1 Tax=Paraphaeosphaeria minitans TaxID=565426 RepID=A0A9P6GB68_9PLEO|nr:hypothetical protein PMIN01_11109 [Paraphaeosphaeria minitans]